MLPVHLVQKCRMHNAMYLNTQTQKIQYKTSLRNMGGTHPNCKVQHSPVLRVTTITLENDVKKWSYQLVEQICLHISMFWNLISGASKKETLILYWSPPTWSPDFCFIWWYEIKKIFLTMINAKAFGYNVVDFPETKT